MRRTLPLLLLALLLPGAPPRAQEAPPPARELTLANETERLVQQIYLYPVGAAEPGADRLGNAVLPPRATLRLALGRTGSCGWEARLVFEDGGVEQRRVDICRSHPRVTFSESGPRRDLVVVNDHDIELRELYLLPANARPGAAPATDRLGTSTVAPGASHPLRLRGADCIFDLRAVFADDSEETRPRVNICHSPRLAFGDASLPLREATLRNQARLTLREVYARPAGTEAWGADRLGSATLEPKAEFRLRLRRQECRFDLRAVFENEREELHPDLDLCAPGASVSLAGLPPGSETRRLLVENASGHAVAALHLVPAESGDWGDNLLTAPLAPEARQQLSLTAGCAADIRVVYVPGSAAEERRGLDLCAGQALRLRPGWTLAARLDQDPPPAEAPPPASDTPPAAPPPEAAPADEAPGRP